MDALRQLRRHMTNVASDLDHERGLRRIAEEALQRATQDTVAATAAYERHVAELEAEIGIQRDRALQAERRARRPHMAHGGRSAPRGSRGDRAWIAQLADKERELDDLRSTVAQEASKKDALARGRPIVRWARARPARSRNAGGAAADEPDRVPAAELHGSAADARRAERHDRQTGTRAQNSARHAGRVTRAGTAVAGRYSGTVRPGVGQDTGGYRGDPAGRRSGAGAHRGRGAARDGRGEARSVCAACRRAPLLGRAPLTRRRRAVQPRSVSSTSAICSPRCRAWRTGSTRPTSCSAWTSRKRATGASAISMPRRRRCRRRNARPPRSDWRRYPLRLAAAAAASLHCRPLLPPRAHAVVHPN